MDSLPQEWIETLLEVARVYITTGCNLDKQDVVSGISHLWVITCV